MTPANTYPENIEREIDSLYGIAEGIDATICAYGCCGHNHVLRNETGRDYRFEITYDSHHHRFNVLIDSYQVPDGEEWNVDAWEAGKVSFDLTPKNTLRNAYRAASGIARGLLNGRDLILPDGSFTNLLKLVEVQS